MSSLRMKLILALAAYSGVVLDRDIGRKIIASCFPSRPIDPAQFAPSTCGRLVFAAERIGAIVPEIQKLHEQHWAETEGYQQGLSLNMQYDDIIEDDNAGKVLQFTARHEGRLVGNFRLYICRSRHTGTRFVMEDTLFLEPEYRAGRNALRFGQYVEACIAQLGIREIRQTAKSNGASTLLEAAGYKAVATEYVKFLPEQEVSHVQ